MDMDTLAARLREAFLGTETGEAVPFDELKDAVKDRWQRVADAAAIRVPFSDAQIERMARAARETLLPDEPEDGAYWPHWLAAVRAALAAASGTQGRRSPVLMAQPGRRLLPDGRARAAGPRSWSQPT